MRPDWSPPGPPARAVALSGADCCRARLPVLRRHTELVDRVRRCLWNRLRHRVPRLCRVRDAARRSRAEGRGVRLHPCGIRHGDRYRVDADGGHHRPLRLRRGVRDGRRAVRVLPAVLPVDRTFHRAPVNHTIRASSLDGVTSRIATLGCTSNRRGPAAPGLMTSRAPSRAINARCVCP